MSHHSAAAAPERRPSPRPRRASLLWSTGVGLLVFSGWIAATGGIDVTVGGLRIRSRTWQRPALLGLACVAVVSVADRRRALAVARHMGAAASRKLDAAWRVLSLPLVPPLVALVATGWTVAGGLLFSTNVAGGADSSGYLNQAKLFARGRVLEDARVSPRPSWPEAAFALAPLGYRPAPDRARLAPTYPPGYPLLMAPAFLIDERAAYLVVPICGALAVWLTFALGRRLGEPGAGAVAAVLVSVSPTFLYQLVQPMSDVPATAAWLLALYLATRPTPWSAAVAGVATGMAISVRPNLMPLAGLVWAACAVSDRSPGRWRRAFGAAAATAPALVALGVLNAIRYGSPWAAGYAPMRDLFAWDNVGPNLDRYPRWLFETHTPLVALFLLAPLWVMRKRQASRPLFLILWAFAVAVVLAYLPYVYFQPWEWTYTRFLLPALPLMWLLSLTPIAQLLRRSRAAIAVLLTVPALVGLVGFSAVAANARYIFELREGERKYVGAADYVSRVLPATALVIGMQHSGSLWFYARRPILRWDHLEPRRLDEAVAWSVAHGYHPFIVADGEEFERMKQRFGPARQRSIDRARALARFGDATVYRVD